jgi:hypothetical protein
LTQEEVLNIFFQATNGDQWVDQTWSNQNIQMCDRTGIRCDSDGAVVGLLLSNQGLSGTIPLELGFLPSLADLDVSKNSLSGQIPEELSLAPLQHLILSENLLTGYVPDSLCRKTGVNGNGKNDVFDCDFIACPMGTENPKGHATLDGPCKPCPMVNGLVLATTDCGSRSFWPKQINGSSKLPDWSIITMIALAGSILILVGWCVLRNIETVPRRARVQQCEHETNKQRVAKIKESLMVEEADLRSPAGDGGSSRSLA